MGSSLYGYLVHMGLVYIVLVDMGLVGMGLAYMWAIVHFTGGWLFSSISPISSLYKGEYYNA